MSVGVMGAGTSWISVADLLERQVPMQSSEAVAVVAELCAVLLGREVPLIPSAADVLINGEGKLSIRTADFGESNAAALGRMLHSLSAAASAPAPLRLFVSQAISSDRYQSISEFAEALASYELPERKSHIQAVYHRWITMRTDPASVAVESPLRAESEQEEKPESKAGARRFPRWAIAAVTVVLVSGAASAAWFATGATVPPIALSSMSALASSVPAAIERAFAWMGAHEPDPAAAAQPEVPKTTQRHNAKLKISAAPDSTGNPDVDATATVVTETTAEAGTNAPAESNVPGEATATTGVVNATPPFAAAVPSDTADSGETLVTVEDEVTVTDTAVYSRAFPDVAPPVMLPRQIAVPDTRSPWADATTTFEVLVDEAGDVEEVKLLSRPSPILATMLLSAAKNWKFKPALKDGRPVKYRLRLDVMTTRP